MSEAAEIFDALKVCSKIHRSEKRLESPKILKRKGVSFESKNFGAHLIVFGASVTVDFWPGTGKWTARKIGAKGYGIKTLLKIEGLMP